MLAITLAQSGKLKAGLERMIALWKTGDAKAMEELALRAPLKRHPEAKLVQEETIYARNGKMVEKIEELAEILRISKEVGVEPMIGIRVRLAAKGSGKWATSGGENAKLDAAGLANESEV